MSRVKYTPRLAVAMVLLFVGSVSHTYVLWTVDDSAIRFRLATLCVLMIAWSLVLAPKAIAAYRHDNRPHRRRFFRLRRAIDAIINEATRLNWLVLDAQRDPQIRKMREPEIDTVKQLLRQWLEEAIESAGQASDGAESDAPFAPRFQSIPTPKLDEPTSSASSAGENERLTA